MQSYLPLLVVTLFVTGIAACGSDSSGGSSNQTGAAGKAGAAGAAATGGTPTANIQAICAKSTCPNDPPNQECINDYTSFYSTAKSTGPACVAALEKALACGAGASAACDGEGTTDFAACNADLAAVQAACPK